MLLTTLSPEHVFYMAQILFAMNPEKDTVSFPLSNLESYSEKSKPELLKKLEWIVQSPFNEAFGLNFTLKNKKTDPVLLIHRTTVGELKVEDGKLNALLDPDTLRISPSGIYYQEKMDIIMSMIPYRDGRFHSSLVSNGELLRATTEVFRFSESVFIHVMPCFKLKSLSDQEKQNIGIYHRVFPFSEQGIADAVDYGKKMDTIFRESKKPHYVQTNITFRMLSYQSEWIPSVLWYSFKENGIFVIDAPGLAKQIAQSVLNTTIHQENRHKDSDWYRGIDVDRCVKNLQNLIDNHLDEIKGYALSRPYDNDGTYYLFFEERYLPIQDKTTFKTPLGNIPLNWHDIPNGAVKNASHYLRFLQACTNNSATIICGKWSPEK